MISYAAIVLAGGAARRMGGAAKPLLPVGGVPMLRRVLAATAGAYPLIVVGPPELAGELPAGAELTREEPPGGGPVAAVAAGLARLLGDRHPVDNIPHPVDTGRDPVDTQREYVDVGGEPVDIRRRPVDIGRDPVDVGRDADGTPGRVLVVAADLPFLTPAAVAALLGGDADVTMFVDPEGHRQHLCAVWRTAVLRAALPPDPYGAPMRRLLAGVEVAEVAWPGDGPPPWYDCDTPEELKEADTADERRSA